MSPKRSKFTQNYPSERKDYPTSERVKALEQEELVHEKEEEEHGKLSIPDTVRIQSYDLPSSPDPGSSPVVAENEEEEEKEEGENWEAA